MAINKKVNPKAKKSGGTKEVKYISSSKGKSSNINKSKKSKKRRILKRILLSMLFICLSVFVVALGYTYSILKSVPPLDVRAILNLSQPTSIYDKDGVFMDNLHTEVDRNVISYDKIPQHLKDAYISIEDQRFFTHSGIDYRRIAGSIYIDVQKYFKGQLNGQSGLHGGSTITQQLLKNTILTNEDFIVERKIKEIWLALKLEEQLNKDQILHQYLNTIPLGGTSYGVDAASNLYFAKSAHELNLIECAYIAGITQAPTYYSAYNINNADNPSVYLDRTKTVLSKMRELGKITEEEYIQAITDLDSGALTFNKKTLTYALEYEWYINPAISKVRVDLKEKYKYTNEEVSNLLANGGLKIYTNMDRSLQDYAQKILNETSIEGDNETKIGNSQTPAFQGSATIVDYKTGNVLVIIGGRGPHDALSTNRAYYELRSIGSTTKPLTVYGPAINERIMTAASVVDDTPILDNIGKTMDNGKPYNPQNDDRKYSGYIPIREGMKYSKNVVSVLTANTIGIDTGIAYGEKFGLKYNKDYTGIATIALGQFRNDPANPDGGNTYILASAFGVFGNNGNYTNPNLYSKVTDSNGKVLLETEVSKKEIFSKQTAYILYDMLKGSRSVTGPSAQWGEMPVAGKTGTTSDSKDLWFAGVTPYLSGSVWLGYYDSSKTVGSNSNHAAKVWGQIMSKAHEGLEVTDIKMPEGIVQVAVCQDSGDLPTALCYNDPRGSRVYHELFISGTEPTTLCKTHVKAKINSSNNKLVSENTPASLIAERIFVKKDYPNPTTFDYKYVLPTVLDDTAAELEPDIESVPDSVEESGIDTKPDSNNKPKVNKKTTIDETTDTISKTQ